MSESVRADREDQPPPPSPCPPPGGGGGEPDEGQPHQEAAPQAEDLTAVCWNVEGKARLEEVEIPLDWDILLQEVSEKVSAAGHILKRAGGSSPRLWVAGLVHRRHVGVATEWGGTTYPWVYLQSERLVVSSVYLPSISRTSEEWDESMQALKQAIQECTTPGCIIILARRGLQLQPIGRSRRFSDAGKITTCCGEAKRFSAAGG